METCMFISYGSPHSAAQPRATQAGSTRDSAVCRIQLHILDVHDFCKDATEGGMGPIRASNDAGCKGAKYWCRATSAYRPCRSIVIDKPQASW